MADRVDKWASNPPFVAYSIKEGPDGERLPVVGIFPDGIGKWDAIAALVEGAAADDEISFEEGLERIKYRAPSDLEELPLARRNGAPRRNWLRDYGRSALDMERDARRLHPEMTLMAAREKVLKDALVRSNRQALRDVDIAKDATRLKQAARPAKSQSGKLAKNSSVGR